MPRRTPVDRRARALVLELARVTEGRPQQWCSLTEVADRSGADAEAVYYAVQQHWVDVVPALDPHSICLTDEGRQIARN
jgi:hypothetical protein